MGLAVLGVSIHGEAVGAAVPQGPLNKPPLSCWGSSLASGKL